MSNHGQAISFEFIAQTDPDWLFVIDRDAAIGREGTSAQRMLDLSLIHIYFLPREIYFISALPSDPQSGYIVTIGVTSLVLSLLATLYPSWRASRLQPAQVLRHD